MDLIGTGILNWPREERVFDRYGVVALWPYDDERRNEPLPFTYEPFEGLKGQLIAKVLEPRKSEHIGDIFRGFLPETPEIGEEIILGEGTVFYMQEDDRTYIGLKPDDGRKKDWLDPKKLYRAHAQYVELYFKSIPAS